MEAVKEALLDEFNNWLNEEKKTRENYKDLMDEFMKEKYAKEVAKGNIFDQIKEMNSPPKECKGCSSTLQNLVACRQGNGQTDNSGRKKRSTEGKS